MSDNKKSNSILRRFFEKNNNLVRREECKDDYDCFTESENYWSYCGDDSKCVEVSVSGSPQDPVCDSDDDCYSELSNVWAYCGVNGRCIYTEE